MEHTQGGQLGPLPPVVRSLWRDTWRDTCHLPSWCVLRVPLPVGAGVKERSHFPAPKCVSVPPAICFQPAAKRTTTNKWNEKCNPVFILKESVEITYSL